MTRDASHLVGVNKSRKPENTHYSHITLQKETEEFPLRFRQTIVQETDKICYYASLIKNGKVVRKVMQDSVEPIEVLAAPEGIPVAILLGKKIGANLQLVNFDTAEIPFRHGAAFIDFDLENKIFYAMPLNVAGKPMVRTMVKYDLNENPGSAHSIWIKDYTAPESKLSWYADDEIRQRFGNEASQETEEIKNNELEIVEEKSAPAIKPEQVVAEVRKEKNKDSCLVEDLRNVINSPLFAQLLAKEVASVLVAGNKIEVIEKIVPTPTVEPVVKIIEDTSAKTEETTEAEKPEKKPRRKSGRELSIEEMDLKQLLTRRKNLNWFKKPIPQKLLDRIEELKNQIPKPQKPKAVTRGNTKSQEGLLKVVTPKHKSEVVQTQVGKNSKPKEINEDLLLPCGISQLTENVINLSEEYSSSVPIQVPVTEIANGDKKSLKIGDTVVIENVYGLSYIILGNGKILAAKYAITNQYSNNKQELFYPDASPAYKPQDPRTFIRGNPWTEIHESKACFYSVVYTPGKNCPEKKARRSASLDLEKYKNYTMYIKTRSSSK